MRLAFVLTLLLACNGGNPVTDSGLADAATVDTPETAVRSVPGSALATYGCACDGVTDDSSCLRAALADAEAWTHRTLEWPDSATCLAANVVWSAPTGSEQSPYVLRGHGSTLKAPDGFPVLPGFPWNPVLRINGGAWLILDDLDFDGNRDTRAPREVPAHNLLIMSGRDIRIIDMDSVDSVCDGLYVAASAGDNLDSRPQRIEVRNPIVRRAFRNNISIINCVDCAVVGDGNGEDASCQLTDASGTPPQAGIDFEPNATNAAPALENVRIEGCYIARNGGTGVLLHTAAAPTGAVVRNNLFEGDRRTFRATCGSAIHTGFNDALIEANTFRNHTIDPGCRAMIDFPATGVEREATTIVRNNRFENIVFDSRATHLIAIHPANRGGHTITGNTFVNIDVAAAGDWCIDGSSTVANDIRDNTIDGIVQSPNPGCP